MLSAQHPAQRRMEALPPSVAANAAMHPLSRNCENAISIVLCVQTIPNSKGLCRPAGPDFCRKRVSCGAESTAKAPAKEPVMALEHRPPDYIQTCTCRQRQGSISNRCPALCCPPAHRAKHDPQSFGNLLLSLLPHLHAVQLLPPPL